MRSILSLIRDVLPSQPAPATDSKPPPSDAMDIDSQTPTSAAIAPAPAEAPLDPPPTPLKPQLPGDLTTAIPSADITALDAPLPNGISAGTQPETEQLSVDTVPSSNPAPDVDTAMGEAEGDRATTTAVALGSEQPTTVDMPQTAVVEPTVIVPSVEANDAQPFQSTTQPETVAASADLIKPEIDQDKPITTEGTTIEAPPVTSAKVARERDEDDDGAPDAKRTKTEVELEPNVDAEPATNGTDFKVPQPVDAAATGSSDAPFTAPTAPAAEPEETWGPMTDLQHKRLTEGLKNIKKNKSAIYFAKPVDPVALNIPNYPNIIKNPMDLSTIEQKLRDRVYNSVNEYVADFDLMTHNAVTFNGSAHVVSVAAINLAAHMKSQVRKIPKPGESVPGPVIKKKQKTPTAPAIPKDTKRRESRPAVTPAAPSSAAPAQVYALPSDGIPQIRRDSSTADGRPKREIHKPPPRDLPYANAKPRKKKYAAELKFCEHVLAEMKRPRYAHVAAPFLLPVDPVALAIPDYFKVIKKPMDLQTAERKLKNGEYENAKEFEQDIRLIFQNCYKFNPADNPVAKMGKEYEDVFSDFWSDKNEWIAEHNPASGPPSPEYDSESESEEEEDDGEDLSAKLAAIQQQISALSEQSQSLLGVIKAQPLKKKKGSKATKASVGGSKAGRKSGGGLSGSSKKSKSSKTSLSRKPVTNVQKKEISERIGDLPPEQIGRCANLIKDSLRRIGKHDMAVSNMDSWLLLSLY